MARIDYEDFNLRGIVLELVGEEERSMLEICIYARQRINSFYCRFHRKFEQNHAQNHASKSGDAAASFSLTPLLLGKAVWWWLFDFLFYQKRCDRGSLTSYFIKYSNLNLNIPRAFFWWTLCAIFRSLQKISVFLYVMFD